MHPGYGFLAENADFAQAVIDAGLTWIGPPPAAIDALGDKVTARHIAQRVGAPLVPGHARPGARTPTRSSRSPREHGLPIAIKAAFGGGGRGLKVARTLEEIPELYDSAVREAVAAFGRGECFVERYLDQPRHVETQCLADAHGNVVVVSTRDCSLQRRHQKLVEEAPAPFLTAEQNAELYQRVEGDPARGRLRRRRHLRVPGRAATARSRFLEVNTRLQVEHPVTEEVTGIDLVREQFRIADGEELGYDDPPLRGHSIEFRINGEDPARNFLPPPGTVTVWQPPSGPGVRLDSGVVAGRRDRRRVRLAARQAHRHRRRPRPGAGAGPPRAGRVRGRRAAHRCCRSTARWSTTRRSRRPSGQPFGVHTRWIETEFDNDDRRRGTGASDGRRRRAAPRETVVVEVGGKRLEVVAARGPRRGAARRRGAAAAGAAPEARRRPAKAAVSRRRR